MPLPARWSALSKDAGMLEPDWITIGDMPCFVSPEIRSPISSYRAGRLPEAS